MRILISLLKKWASRSRCEVISGHGDTSPYLVRYHLINNRFFKLYLHYFLRSDHDVPHDHPWAFSTMMLQGYYCEELYDWRSRSFTKIHRSLSQNAFVRRPASTVHRVVVNESLPLDRKDEAPMTLFFATKKDREWGFIKDHETGPKWTHWKEYLGIK